jgi:hypothetical protein
MRFLGNVQVSALSRAAVLARFPKAAAVLALSIVARKSYTALVLAVLLLAGAHLAAHHAAAQTESPIIINAFPNAPGWATLEWRHTGDGVFWFVIEHEATLVATPDRDKRIWTITHLQPSTTYRFRVCAVFAFNRACSGFASVTTLPPPPPPTPPTPPPLAAGPQLTAFVSSFESLNFPGRFIRHRNSLGEITEVLTALDRADATFLIRPALDGTPDAISLEASNFPGHYLRHQNFILKLHKNDNSELFKKDASFLPTRRGVFAHTRLESVNFRGHFIRHSHFQLSIARDDGTPLFDKDATWWRVPILSATAPAGAFSFESINFPGRFIRHRNSLGEITPVVSNLDKQDANFIIRPALNGSPIGISFESVNFPGHFLRHQNFRIKLHRFENTQLFRDDASFEYNDGGCQEGNCRVSFESVNLRGHHIRHTNFELWLAKSDGSILFGNDSTWQPQPAR